MYYRAKMQPHTPPPPFSVFLLSVFFPFLSPARERALTLLSPSGCRGSFGAGIHEGVTHRFTGCTLTPHLGAPEGSSLQDVCVVSCVPLKCFDNLSVPQPERRVV